MKGNLIAAGGALITAAALIGMASPASAAPVACDLSVADSHHSLRIDGYGVYAGRRNAGACEGHKDENRHDRGHDQGWNGDDHSDDQGWNGNGWNNDGWDRDSDWNRGSWNGDGWNNDGWNQGNWNRDGWNRDGWDHGYWNRDGWGRGHDSSFGTDHGVRWTDRGWGTGAHGAWGGYSWPGIWFGR
jgi:hypothetical protein